MSVSTDIQVPHNTVPIINRDAVVVGAGPYGLSVAAHLQSKGLKVAVFGRPIALWRNNMPKGMLLRSYWWAVNLSDPRQKYTLAHYLQSQGQAPPDILPIETFIDYALWFQTQLVPDVDETYVACIEHKDCYYEVTLVDGRRIQSPIVVMAPGLAYYTHRPPEYSFLPNELLTHTSDHYRFDGFAGKRVVVIGGGQSTLEISALLHENEADVHIVSRRAIRWLSGESLKSRTFINQLRSPTAGIAPGWFNWGLENLPYAFYRLPRSTKDRLLRGRGQYGPAGAHWLRPRVIGKVKLHEEQTIQKIWENGSGLELLLSNNEKLQADHVILGTGYRVNIWNLPMLHSELLSKIQTFRNAPILNSHFESNIAGLYFVGLTSVSSFGPFYRFVVGDAAAARQVASAAMRQIARIR